MFTEVFVEVFYFCVSGSVNMPQGLRPCGLLQSQYSNPLVSLIDSWVPLSFRLVFHNSVRESVCPFCENVASVYVIVDDYFPEIFVF
jgi:hypothetical protein